MSTAAQYALTSRKTRPASALEVGDVRVDLARREVSVAGRPVALRPKEFDLLAAFAAEPGVVLTRDRILNRVWGYKYLGESRTIDVHVAWLREKLRGSSVRIQTVWSIGYKLVAAEVAEAAEVKA